MVYIVEDDDSIRQLVEYTLNTTGVSARGFSAPSEFFRALDGGAPDLIMLDIMLPEEDGLSILEKLRKNKKYDATPIILLTAKGTEYDKVMGFEKGADDYIPKPFGMMELVARVKAHLRRKGSDASDEIHLGALMLSTKKHAVEINNTPVSLTHKEFELLVFLIKNKNIVLTRDKLLDEVWGYSFDGESRTVDVHIRTLRHKLGDLGNAIETVRGVGYKFSEAGV